MKVIQVKDIFKDLNSADAGSEIFKISEQGLLNNDIVVLDMNEVLSVSTAFMNTSFGFLIDKYGIEKTKDLFRFRNITKSQIERFRKYFDDYEKLYAS